MTRLPNRPSGSSAGNVSYSTLFVIVVLSEDEDDCVILDLVIDRMTRTIYEYPVNEINNPGKTDDGKATNCGEGSHDNYGM